MKLTILYILFIFYCVNLTATDVRMVNSTISEYPERNTEIYFLSDEKKPILNLDKSLLEYKVNGIEVNDYNLISPNEITFNPISVVISIDNSLQNEQNNEFLKRTLKRFTKDILNNDVEIALQSYNSSSFLLHDFTQDFSKLERALNNLSFRSVSNYNTGFLNKTTGSLEIANRANRKSFILNITSGNSIGDSNSIISKANDYEIAIYNFVFGSNISKNLKSVSDKTNGKYYSVADEEMFYSHLLNSILKEAGTIPYRLIYNYPDCETINKLDLKYNVLINDTYNALYRADKFPFIEVFPNPIDYGVVESGKDSSIFLTVRARNSNVLLQDIVYDDNQYEISPDNFKNRILQNNSPNIFSVKLKSSSTDYNYSKIELISDACQSTFVDIFNGKKEGDSQETELKVISPNGGETYFSGQYVNIEWDGVLESQQVLLEFSSDNGSKWELITEEGKNKSYNWLVPDINSKEMLLRVDIPSGSVQFDKVKYISDLDRNKKIKKAVLSYDNRYAAVSFLDGSIFTWDLEENKLETQLRDKNQGIITSDIEFGVNTSLIAAAFGKNDEYSIVVWDADDPSNTSSRSFNSSVNDIEWSSDGTTLFIGLDNGNLERWNLAGNNLDVLTNLSNSINSISINNDNDVISISTSNLLYLTDFVGNRLDSISINGIFDLKWNNNGSRLFVVYDFKDLRFFSLTGQNGSYKLNQDQRIVRSQSTNLTAANWTSNNTVLIQSENSELLEHWNINNTKIKDIDIHKKEINTSYTNGKLVISSIDTNTALVWNIDDFPFSYRTLDSDISDSNWSIQDKIIEINDIDLGDLCINESYYFEFENNLINKNAPTVTIDSILSVTNEIEILNQVPIDIEINESLELEFNFSPVNSGIFQEEIIIYYGNRVDTVEVRCNIINLEISIIDDNFEFVNTLVNSNKSVKKDILINNTNSTIVFDDVEFIIGKDEFSIIESNLDGISIGEKLYLDISFQPKESGYYSGLIKLSSKELCSSIFIELNGNAVNSNIQFVESVDFGTLDCKDEIDTTIYIYNFSQDAIELEKMNIINGNSFQVDADVPKPIPSGDSLKVDIRFINNGVGSFNSTVEFTTNLSGSDSIISFDVTGLRDTINLNIISEKLDFGTVETNQTSSKTINIVNNSMIDFTFDFPLEIEKFKLLTAIPQTIGLGDTSKVTFQFIGNDRDTTIDFDFFIGEGCDSFFTLPLSVIVSDGIPIIGFNNLKDLGTINCSNELLFSITLHNVGSNNLIIDSLYFEGINSADFELKEPKEIYNILPNDSAIIVLIYTPNNLGNISSDLVIRSNASNSISSLNTIRINAFQNKTLLQLSEENILFEGLRSNRRYSKEVTVKNIGNTTVDIDSLSHTFFEVDSISPKIIAPNESAIVYMSFLGGDINTTYNGTIILIDDCENQYNINLTADVGGSDYITIRPESIKAKTGSNVDLKISFVNTSGIDIPLNDTISTKLILNASIIAPVDEKYYGTIVNNERVIDLKIPLNEQSTIYSIPMVVTLGDTSYSEIRLEESSHLENGFYIEDIEKGSITVTNIDTIPTDRYIQDNGRAYMSETIPSPIQGFGKIEYRVIESTNVSISIFDILGNRIEVIIDEYHLPGEYTVEINPQNLSAGNYLYKLETPSMEIIKKMTIIR